MKDEDIDDGDQSNVFDLAKYLFEYVKCPPIMTCRHATSNENLKT